MLYVAFLTVRRKIKKTAEQTFVRTTENQLQLITEIDETV